MLKPGLMLLCLTLSLTACAPRQIVRTEAVKVNVRTYVALDAELTAPVAMPYAGRGPMSNDDLQALAEARGAAIELANDRLAKIRELQPVGPVR